MSRKPRWKAKSFTNGTWVMELFSWKYFHDFIRQQMLPYSHYIWRGQRDSSWGLQSSLDRALRGKPYADRPQMVARHLERFKYASRGRRTRHAPEFADENDWWALGQHSGLATPLLDWTESPFVALYFAFSDAIKPSSGYRSVWALGAVHHKNQLIEDTHGGDGPPPLLSYIRPLQDDNSRLVNQAALFTGVPLGITVEQWVEEHFQGTTKEAVLIHLRIPDKDRLDCLRTLNKMNINHGTLFPDLYGSAQHCNKSLEIKNY